MSLFDDSPFNPHEQNPERHPPTEDASPSTPAEPPVPLLAGDPLSYRAPDADAGGVPDPVPPEDLRISWSWPHLLLFVLFWFASQIAIGVAVVTYFSAERHLTQNQLKQLVDSDPRLIVGTSVIEFALIFLFLYVTLAVLRDLPFWRSLGWRKLNPDSAGGKGRPWMYFFSGCGLSIFVLIAGSKVKNADHVPIQELFKNRTGAMLLMAMAVFVAPLVEETIFRGYLYPVFARIISAVARFFGMDFSSATRTGVAASIIVTGMLFGLLHAPQLGWTWGLVSLLTLVGVIFTFVRAWTGTVVASFLLHLGYNSMLAIASVIATKGFTHMPTGQ
jgi:membrane protease YdiL (CAAX protease family)